MIAAWAILGVLALLIEAIFRLGFIARDAFASPWQPWHWLTLTLWTAAMLWGEGYRVFQKHLAPRVVTRARKLSRQPFGLAALLAPFYALSFFADERRRVTIAWAATAFIGVFAWSMHLVPQPWRGIIDFGVAAALTWGAVAIIHEAFAAD